MRNKPAMGTQGLHGRSVEPMRMLEPMWPEPGVSVSTQSKYLAVIGLGQGQASADGYKNPNRPMVHLPVTAVTEAGVNRATHQ